MTARAMTVLTLAKIGNTWVWNPMHETYGVIELKSNRNIFSGVAMSAQSVEITLRPQKLNLQNAIQLGEDTLFLTTIDSTSSRYELKVIAARLSPVTVTRKTPVFTRNENNNPVRGESISYSFPAWLTEKYVKYQQPNPNGVSETALVLIVPKAVTELKVGDVITVSGEDYAVELRHLLDPDKNEYEIVARSDT